MTLSDTAHMLGAKLGWEPEFISGIQHILQSPLYHLRLARDGNAYLKAIQLDGVYAVIVTSQVTDLVKQLRPYVTPYGMQPYRLSQRNEAFEVFGSWRKWYHDWEHQIVGVLPCHEPYELVSLYVTHGVNWDLSHDDLMHTLKHWERYCRFHISGAGYEWVELAFETLPDDVEQFAAEALDICFSIGNFYETEYSASHPYDPAQPYEVREQEKRAYAITCIAEQIRQTHLLEMWWL